MFIIILQNSTYHCTFTNLLLPNSDCIQRLKHLIQLIIDILFSIGNNSKESISSANQLCGLLRVAGKFEQAEKMLGETLTICRATYGNM